MSQKRILFILPYPLSTVPGQRLKFEQYFDFMQSQGYLIEVDCFIGKPLYKIMYKKGKVVEKVWRTLFACIKRFWLLRKIKNYDVIYLFLWGTPYGPAFFEYFLYKSKVPVI